MGNYCFKTKKKHYNEIELGDDERNAKLEQFL